MLFVVGVLFVILMYWLWSSVRVNEARSRFVLLSVVGLSASIRFCMLVMLRRIILLIEVLVVVFYWVVRSVLIWLNDGDMIVVWRLVCGSMNFYGFVSCFGIVMLLGIAMELVYV